MIMKAAAVAIAILTSCDYVAFGGQYTTTVMQVLAAIRHSFV